MLYICTGGRAWPGRYDPHGWPLEKWARMRLLQFGSPLPPIGMQHVKSDVRPLMTKLHNLFWVPTGLDIQPRKYCSDVQAEDVMQACVEAAQEKNIKLCTHAAEQANAGMLCHSNWLITDFMQAQSLWNMGVCCCIQPCLSCRASSAAKTQLGNTLSKLIRFLILTPQPVYLPT
jgi:hypothetical protein